MTASSAPTTTRPDAKSRRAYWIVLFASWVLRLLLLTLRFEVESPGLLRAANGRRTAILVFWHNRLLMVPVFWNRYLVEGGRPQGLAMTSTSSDGELIAQFLQRFGIGAVRGSATRRGTAALREMLGWLKRGHDVGLTPDGSRGPAYELKPGVVLLAQLSGAPLLPIAMEYSSAWRLKSWDRFFIPKPFSKVTFRCGPLHEVSRTSTPEAFEIERRKCEDAMLAMIRER